MSNYASKKLSSNQWCTGIHRLESTLTSLWTKLQIFERTVCAEQEFEVLTHSGFRQLLLTLKKDFWVYTKRVTILQASESLVQHTVNASTPGIDTKNDGHIYWIREEWCESQQHKYQKSQNWASLQLLDKNTKIIASKGWQHHFLHVWYCIPCFLLPSIRFSCWQSESLDIDW